MDDFLDDITGVRNSEVPKNSDLDARGQEATGSMRTLVDAVLGNRPQTANGPAPVAAPVAAPAPSGFRLGGQIQMDAPSLLGAEAHTLSASSLDFASQLRSTGLDPLTEAMMIADSTSVQGQNQFSLDAQGDPVANVASAYTLSEQQIIARLQEENAMLKRSLMLRESLNQARATLSTNPIPFFDVPNAGAMSERSTAALDTSNAADHDGSLTPLPTGPTIDRLHTGIEPPLETGTQQGPAEHPPKLTHSDLMSKPVSTLSFPLKLYRILEDAEKDGFQDVVSFLPDKTSFMIMRPERFVKEVMPKYFKACRLSSFNRQLNLYGFKRLVSGDEYGAVFHPNFVRGQPHRLLKIHRKKQRTPGGASSPYDDQEAILRAMPALKMIQHQQNKTLPPK